MKMGLNKWDKSNIRANNEKALKKWDHVNMMKHDQKKLKKMEMNEKRWDHDEIKISHQYNNQLVHPSNSVSFIKFQLPELRSILST